MIIDFLAAERVDLTVADQHHVHVQLRKLFGKGSDFRVALVAPSEAVRAQLLEAIAVRDLLTGRVVEQLPEVRFVDALDEARAWVDSPDTDPNRR